MPAATTSLKDNLKALRALPHASPVVVAASGSASLEERQLCANAFEHFILQEGTHGYAVARRLRWFESNVRREGAEGGGISAELIAEIDVERGMVSLVMTCSLLSFFVLDMTNVHGMLAGPCAIHILDMCVTPLRNLYLMKKKKTSAGPSTLFANSESRSISTPRVSRRRLTSFSINQHSCTPFCESRNDPTLRRSPLPQRTDVACGSQDTCRRWCAWHGHMRGLPLSKQKEIQRTSPQTQIYEKESGQLVASCMHTNVNPTRAKGRL